MQFRRKEGVESAPMQGETVVYNPATRRFCVLNATAAFIWELLKDARTPEEIAARVCEEFDGVAPADAERDVRDALEQLMEHEMVGDGRDAAGSGT